MDVVSILLIVSLVLFFGFFAEFIFRKFNIPDVLFLIILGFVLGPTVLSYVTPMDIVGFAPVFTTFTLLFLLFDGAFNIHLSSLVREFSESFVLTLYNFLLSTIVATAIIYVAGMFIGDGIPFLVALLTGFTLGGVSSSFVIPILKQVKVSPRLYSLLTLESALTDVFCIVFALTIIELFSLGGFGLQRTFTQLVSLFAVAGLVGVIAGIVWIILILKVFKEHNYIMTIAYLTLVYVITEFLSGNGAIAALFFGLMLKNSKQLSSIIHGITSKEKNARKKALKGDYGESVTTPSEEYFYHQISFFLKTFFFVYIGILIDISDIKALILGIVLSIALMFSRAASKALTRGMLPESRLLVNSMFARGLAAAAIAQLALEAGLPGADFIVKVIYVTITGTIILSSVRVFLVKRKMPKQEEPVNKIKKQKIHKGRAKKGVNANA